MAQNSGTTPLGHTFIRMMSQAMNPQGGVCMAPISHRIPVVLEPGQLPVIFTVDLAPTEQGAFFVTCREVPEMRTCSPDERQGLERAELIIQLALQPAQNARHLPR